MKAQQLSPTSANNENSIRRKRQSCWLQYTVKLHTRESGASAWQAATVVPVHNVEQKGQICRPSETKQAPQTHSCAQYIIPGGCISNSGQRRDTFQRRRGRPCSSRTSAASSTSTALADTPSPSSRRLATCQALSMLSRLQPVRALLDHMPVLQLHHPPKWPLRMYRTVCDSASFSLLCLQYSLSSYGSRCLQETTSSRRS